jgi:AcrR family transcriptional regulator
MAMLLDAAAELFGETGYAGTTTNAIAARAGVSPGTLYQFFPHKEALAEALTERYLEQMAALHAAAFASDAAQLPMDRLLDQLIDPLIAFNLANPGFQALFAGPDAPQHLSGAAARLHQAVLQRTDDLLAALIPGLSTARRQRCSLVAVQLAKALLPAILAAGGAEGDALVAELKHALSGYLLPLRDGRR